MESIYLLVLALAILSVAHGAACPPAMEVKGVTSNNPSFDGTCQVYKRGAAPCTTDTTELGESVGWTTLVIVGPLFSVFAIGMTISQFRALGVKQSSEMFNSGGRNVGAGLTASTIVSKWVWAASLLMSSHMGWVVGLSGPFWYASGATIPILLFAIVAVAVKRRASHMHTFLEVIKVRFGTIPHIIMIAFALTTNVIVTSMLLLGGAHTVEDVTGTSKITAALLFPLTCSWAYVAHGGLRGTFLAGYLFTIIIFLVLFIFSFGVYAGNGEQGLWGNAGRVHDGVTKATVHGFFNATFSDTQLNDPTFAPSATAFFDGMGGIMGNDGECYNQKREKVGKTCGFIERGKDKPCCDINYDNLAGGNYCRKEGTDCVSLSPVKHFASEGCNVEEGEVCVTSFLTMGSTIGLIFGITNIVGNFGTVFVDQSYWQSAIAAKSGPAGPIGFLIGGLVWFAVPFCMATAMGIGGRALTTHTDINGALGAFYITGGVSGAGLTPAKVVSKIFGPFGAFLMLLQLFAAISSTGAAEILAVSSIMTYDIYYEYVHPELKQRRMKRKAMFDATMEKFLAKVDDRGATHIKPSQVQDVLHELASSRFFTEPLSSTELTDMGKHLTTVSSTGHGGRVPIIEIYTCVALDPKEGELLLRITRMFSLCFAVFMGFLATFLLALGLPLGHVYMSMGCIVGSAVGPAALSLTMETANGKAIGAGAVGGFLLAMIMWVARAQDEFGEITYNTMMADWPWVLGNLGALCGGTGIALVGSIIWPNTEFKWRDLNATIPLVDDVEPPPEDEIFEDEDFKNFMSKGAAISSIFLSFFLVVLWPAPMHLFSGIFSETGFVTWIVLDFIWLLVAGGVIMALPAYEMNNVLWDSSKERQDTLKLKPGSAGSIVEETKEEDDVVLKKSPQKSSFKDAAKDMKERDELQKRLAELENAAKKPAAAEDASIKDLQKQLTDLKEEKKKLVAAAKKTAATKGNKVAPSNGQTNGQTNGEPAKPSPKPKPKVLNQKSHSAPVKKEVSKDSKDEVAKDKANGHAKDMAESTEKEALVAPKELPDLPADEAAEVTIPIPASNSFELGMRAI